MHWQRKISISGVLDSSVFGLMAYCIKDLSFCRPLKWQAKFYPLIPKWSEKQRNKPLVTGVMISRPGDNDSSTVVMAHHTHHNM